MILSTPRSGSTALCSLLYNSGLGTPHEYFQPHQYLPALARRVGLTRVDPGNLHLIVAFLRARRCRGGWFAYNIHSSHRDIWSAFKPSLAAAGMLDGSVLLFCRRKDLASQLASYYIARRLGQWGNLGDQADVEHRLDAFDEAFCAQLGESLVKQRAEAERIFAAERGRFRAVRVVEFEEPWERRVQVLAEILPLARPEVSTRRSDAALKDLVLAQMRASPAVARVLAGG